ncbi:hypothetical protein LX36DRAFT_727402 [Colletotrichum falcatum]|nr:hypothetical protein LX36DRAFT_727402 [Colletotrichum falcatum]
MNSWQKIEVGAFPRCFSSRYITMGCWTSKYESAADVRRDHRGPKSRGWAFNFNLVTITNLIIYPITLEQDNFATRKLDPEDLWPLFPTVIYDTAPGVNATWAERLARVVFDRTMSERKRADNDPDRVEVVAFPMPTKSARIYVGASGGACDA